MKITEVKGSAPARTTSRQPLPPSVVFKSVPRSPATSPVFLSRNETEKRCARVGATCEVHVMPLSVVAIIEPYVPTAQPRFASSAAKVIEYKWSFVGVEILLHPRPELVVRSTVPRAPTAIARRSSKTYKPLSEATERVG